MGKKVARESRVYLVGASALDVSRLLAAVAHALSRGLGGAVAREMADLAAVVALLSLGAVTAHVTETAAGVAGSLTRTAEAATAASLLATITTTAAVATATIASSLRTVASDVASLSALVALLSAHLGARSSLLGALTGDVTG